MKLKEIERIKTRIKFVNLKLKTLNDANLMKRIQVTRSID